jgi:hypothetical protein
VKPKSKTQFWLTVWGSSLLHGLLLLAFLAVFYAVKRDLEREPTVDSTESYTVDYAVEYSAHSTSREKRVAAKSLPSSQSGTNIHAVPVAAEPSTPLGQEVGNEAENASAKAEIRTAILARLREFSGQLPPRVSEYFQSSQGRHDQIELTFRTTEGGQVHFIQANLIPPNAEPEGRLNSWLAGTVFFRPIFWKSYAEQSAPSFLRLVLKVNPFLPSSAPKE